MARGGGALTAIGRLLAAAACRLRRLPGGLVGETAGARGADGGAPPRRASAPAPGPSPTTAATRLRDKDAGGGRREEGAADRLELEVLVLLHELTPLERSVFLLRLFGYAYEEIADVVGQSEDRCRELWTRVRRETAAARERSTTARDRHVALVARFLHACRLDEHELACGLLNPDAVLYPPDRPHGVDSDAAVHGARRIVPVVTAMARGASRDGGSLRVVRLRSTPVALFLAENARVLGSASFEIAEDRVQTIRCAVHDTADSTRLVP